MLTGLLLRNKKQFKTFWILFTAAALLLTAGILKVL
jgi:hypothetical protein